MPGTTTIVGCRPLSKNPGALHTALDTSRNSLILVPTEEAEGNPGSLVVGQPEALLDYRYGVPDRRVYDLAPDGERFLMIRDGVEDTAAGADFQVVLNWSQELLERVPVD